MRKHPLSLLEIIIVIFLITLVTGALGYNMKGALDKGRVFRTEKGMEELHDLLMLSVAEGNCTLQQARDTPKECLELLAISKNPDKLLTDGWGDQYSITLNQSGNDLVIRSSKLQSYLDKKRK